MTTPRIEGFTLTRPPGRARRSFGGLSLVAGLLAAGLLAAGLLGAGLLTAAVPVRAAEMVTPLPWRVGGRVGFTVDAAAFPDSAGHSLEIYVRVPPATLAALTRDPEGKGRLRLAARLKSAFGASLQNGVQEFEIAPSDSGAGFGKVVLLRFPTRPGVQRLEVRLEDLYSRKRGIAYMGRKVSESGEALGEFEVSGPRAGMSLSDLELAWTEDSTMVSGPFMRAGHRVLPNPERLFGLFANELRAFYVARGRSDDERPWSWRARIRNAEGRIVAERESTVAGGPSLEGTFTADLTHEPAGGYDLELGVWRAGERDTLVRRTHWSLAWQPGSWFRNPRDVEDYVHFLLSSDDEERFMFMHPGEQEQLLDRFWRERDPTPGTARNETRDAFLLRVELANRTYGRGTFVPGIFSDMGRVFVRYGEPGEVLKQVVPSGDNTLRKVIEELSLSEDRDIGEVHQKGLGGDIRPYEVWIYEGEIPLPPDADPRVERNMRRKRLVFLFVDEQGTGDYRLRFSTE